ncbi:unnamed protein product [marine sediment metagenome]|uniref:Uncharacterized protein n=1 Tax=marine sediment metagenome TaxID=412755 RepID=X1GCC3_9ZZZZ
MAKKPVTKNNQIKKTQKNPNKTPTKAIPITYRYLESFFESYNKTYD